MCLMQFLTVGRSFGGAKEGPNRYRLNEQCLLPKFGKANPVFRTTMPVVASEVFVVPSRIGVGETGSLFELQPPRPPGAETLPVSPINCLDSSMVMAPAKLASTTLIGEPLKTAASVKPQAFAGVGFKKLSRKAGATQPELSVVPAVNPFASPSAPAVVTEPPMVPPPKKKWHWLLEGMLYTRRRNVSTRRTPVQGEWSLGGVTVVRNDLSDTDLEVVPASFTRGEPVRCRTVEPVSRDRSLAGISGRWIGWLLNSGRVRF